MRCRVLSPLHHDNKAYSVGAEIDLTPEVAEGLDLFGVVEILELPEPVTEPPPKAKAEPKNA